MACSINQRQKVLGRRQNGAIKCTSFKNRYSNGSYSNNQLVSTPALTVNTFYELGKLFYFGHSCFYEVINL